MRLKWTCWRGAWTCVIVLAALWTRGSQAECRVVPLTGGADASALEAARAASPLDKPWGELDTREFALELSDELLPEVARFLDEPRWLFSGYSFEQVVSLLRTCRFSEAEVRRIVEGAEAEVAFPPGLPKVSNSVPLTEMVPMAVSLYPPPDLVFNLGTEARKQIYAVLAGSDQNPWQRNPFRLPVAEFDAWFAQAGLPAGKLAQVKRLTYPNNQVLCLADLEPLQRVLTEAEMKQVLKAVYRNPTLVMRLKLSSDTDMAAVSRYWGRGGRARTIKPFLEGLAKTPGTSSVNVAFLMPAFARTHLYTFPDPAKEPAYSRNCGLWTALNFFNEQPDNRYLDRESAQQALRAQFETGGGAAGYGDLVALYSPAGDLVHVGVHVAEDVVFTRSGMGNLQPWVLMKVPEMVRRFQTLGQIQTVIHHRKLT